MKLDITYKGNPVLETLCDVIPTENILDDEHQELFKNMLETLAGTGNGVALAAPQIGVAKRVFVISPDVFDMEENHDLEVQTVCVNPRIVWHSKDEKKMEEGCLSIPGIFGKVKRHTRATIEAQDIDGKIFELSGTNLLAQIFQHEIDHLDGILFDTKATDIREDKEKKE